MEVLHDTPVLVQLIRLLLYVSDHNRVRTDAVRGRQLLGLALRHIGLLGRNYQGGDSVDRGWPVGGRQRRSECSTPPSCGGSYCPRSCVACFLPSADRRDRGHPDVIRWHPIFSVHELMYSGAPFELDLLWTAGDIRCRRPRLFRARFSRAFPHVTARAHARFSEGISALAHGAIGDPGRLLLRVTGLKKRLRRPRGAERLVRISHRDRASTCPSSAARDPGREHVLALPEFHGACPNLRPRRAQRQADRTARCHARTTASCRIAANGSFASSRERLGMVFQRFELFRPASTVPENAHGGARSPSRGFTSPRLAAARRARFRPSQLTR